MRLPMFKCCLQPGPIPKKFNITERKESNYNFETSKVHRTHQPRERSKKCIPQERWYQLKNYTNVYKHHSRYVMHVRIYYHKTVDVNQ